MQTHFSCSTEIGLLALWDSQALSFLNDTNYDSHLVNNADIAKLMNKGSAVIWGTGGDGVFDVIVRVNPEKDLSENETSVVEMSAKDLKLEIVSELIVGSPESAGDREKEGADSNYIFHADVVPGTYSVNIYFLYDENDEDKNGYFVILRSVSEDHVFPIVEEPPQLG